LGGAQRALTETGHDMADKRGGLTAG
jgi:hypothetical protein